MIVAPRASIVNRNPFIEVKPFSDEYFALVKAHPALGRYLAEGKPMILVVDGRAYKIVKA